MPSTHTCIRWRLIGTWSWAPATTLHRRLDEAGLVTREVRQIQVTRLPLIPRATAILAVKPAMDNY